ncbi:MAG: NosD domain-containing protein, partial [Nanoarchaeota archaeon]
IHDNVLGVSVEDSSNDIIHNHFINNYEQAYSIGGNVWDDDERGNYWGDYAGEDNDGDGIGDTPRLIPEGDQDNHPLMYMNAFTSYPYLEEVVVKDNYGPLTPRWGYDTFADIQSGHDAVATDGTVIVKNGMYSSVVISNRINLVGEQIGDFRPTIDGGDYGDVVRITADDVAVSGFVIQNSGNGAYDAGIDIEEDRSTVHDCTIQNNEYGIYARRPGNIFYNNDFLDNDYGLGGNIVAPPNKVYHNNFIGNTHHIHPYQYGADWEEPYPEGGNYWFGYAGIDQNEDGIGDTPQFIGSGYYDDYPFMAEDGWETGPEIILSETFASITGLYYSPELADTFISDNVYIQIDSEMILSGSPEGAPVQIEFETHAPVHDDMRFVLEAHTLGAGIQQVIELFNYESDAYETVDSRRSTPNNDSIVIVHIVDDPTRFIDGSTGEMKARLSWRNVGRQLVLWPYRAYIDQVIWLFP